MVDLSVSEGIWLFYDGKCPICSSVADYLRIKKQYGSLNLVDARDPLNYELVRSVNEQGFDLDEGVVIVHDGRFLLGQAAKKANVDYEITAEWTFGDEVFDPDCAQLVRDAAISRGISQMDMTSIAGYDAYFISRIAPTALVFSPCIDGIIHNEAEDVKREPTIEAVNVFFDAVVARADR